MLFGTQFGAHSAPLESWLGTLFGTQRALSLGRGLARCFGTRIGALLGIVVTIKEPPNEINTLSASCGGANHCTAT